MFFKPLPLYFKSNKMGCCISNWRTKKRSIECYHDHIHVVDRLAIPPKTPKIAIPVSNKISPSPPSPTTISSCSSLSSGSSISSSIIFQRVLVFLCQGKSAHNPLQLKQETITAASVTQCVCREIGLATKTSRGTS